MWVKQGQPGAGKSALFKQIEDQYGGKDVEDDFASQICGRWSPLQRASKTKVGGEYSTTYMSIALQTHTSSLDDGTLDERITVHYICYRQGIVIAPDPDAAAMSEREGELPRNMKFKRNAAKFE